MSVIEADAELRRSTMVMPWFLIAKGAVWLCMTLLLWQTAWLSDDAVITLRSALNWAHGYGPHFNIDEAAASYTHPLWFALITLQGLVSGSWIYGTLYLALAFASAALLMLLLQVRNLWQLSTVSVFLLLGNTLTDWLGSGLEGALAAALVCAVFYAAIQRPHPVVGLLMGLLLLCRLDFAVLLTPVGIWLLLRWRRQPRPLAAYVSGLLLPLAGWALWAQLTYSRILPSTFTAKTNSEIPATELLARGIEYLVANLMFDPVIAAVIVLLVVNMRYGGPGVRLWLTGLVAYVAYITVIGGDYLLGRFLLIPTFGVLLALTATDLPARRPGRVLWVVPVFTLLLAVPATRVFDFSAVQPNRARALYFQDERPGWSVAGRSLDPLGAITIRHGFIRTDLPLLDQVARSWPEDVRRDGRTLVSCHGLGAVSFITPLPVHIIDPCGLTDPFLASLPFRPNGFWKAGHFERPLPQGYERAVQTHNPDFVVDPVLRERLRGMWASTLRP